MFVDLFDLSMFLDFLIVPVIALAVNINYKIPLVKLVYLWFLIKFDFLLLFDPCAKITKLID